MAASRNFVNKIRSVEEGLTGAVSTSCRIAQLLNDSKAAALPNAASALSTILSVSATIRLAIVGIRSFYWWFDRDTTNDEKVFKMLLDMLTATFAGDLFAQFKSTGALESLYSSFAIIAFGEFIMALYDYNKLKSIGAPANQITDARNDLIIKGISLLGWSLLAYSQPAGWLCIAAASIYYFKKDVIPAAKAIHSFMFPPPAAQPALPRQPAARITGVNSGGYQAAQQQSNGNGNGGFQPISGTGHRMV